MSIIKTFVPALFKSTKNIIPMQQSKKAIEEYYALHASPKDMMSPALQQKILKNLLTRHLKKEFLQNANVLDYGCGLGSNIPTLHELGVSSIMAVDISQKAIALAKQQYSNFANIEFKHTQEKNSSYLNKKYDLIVCTEVLEHVGDPKEVVAQFADLLSEKGYVFVSTPNYLNPSGIVKIIMDTILSTKDWNPWGAHKGGFERLITAPYVQSLFNTRFSKVADTGADIVLSWCYLGRHILSPWYEKLFWPLPFANIVKLFLMNYYALYQKK